ncbi:MAG TPA: DUF4347 domain-containing protein, partial [Burkholderiales bacterium]|nr:DUF4347 domain-containing protein [Burkholderiales bacterium]
MREWLKHRRGAAASATPVKTNRTKSTLMMQLEPRIMFDGAAIVTADAAIVPADATETATPPVESHIDTPPPAVAPPPTPQNEELQSPPVATLAVEQEAPDIVQDAAPSAIQGESELPADNDSTFDSDNQDVAVDVATSPTPVESVLIVDGRIPDYQQIVDSVEPGVMVLVLDSNQDGVKQIADALSGMRNIASISVVSHGDDGVLLLGNGPLFSGNLDRYTNELKTIGDALRPDGDILLYGCEVGASESGQNFVRALAQATGADVAASNNDTGANGDWDLEITQGVVAAPSVLRTDQLVNYEHDLATFSVSTLAQLQSALTTAASNGEADTITLTADIVATGTGSMTSGFLVNINLAESQSLTIVGGGFKFDAAYYGRTLSVSAGDTVDIQNLTITGGIAVTAGANGGASASSSLGAGIVNQGVLTLSDVTVTKNVASGGGGGHI